MRSNVPIFGLVRHPQLIRISRAHIVLKASIRPRLASIIANFAFLVPVPLVLSYGENLVINLREVEGGIIAPPELVTPKATFIQELFEILGHEEPVEFVVNLPCPNLASYASAHFGRL